ncbi:MAG: TraR/DksA family transcriptional regulator [Caldilineae bacterium]|nr:MAG: TraR/DksA family transcriptional regulator [Caldilineae bacterium]
MTRDDVRLRRLLEEEREQLLADLAYFSQVEYIDISAGNHLADNATAAFDQASDQALLRSIRRRLARIERALAKMENGAYGYCEGCGDPIDFARLKALPDARFCLACQRRREMIGNGSLGPRAYEQGQLPLR